MAIHFTRQAGESLQAALRRSIVVAIGEGRLKPGQALPPTRILAGQLAIARNTVSAAYDDLIECGVLETTPRRGVYVASTPPVAAVPSAAAGAGADWSRHLKLRAMDQRNIVKPADWQTYPYPFVYGQIDPALFPLADWRTCSRDALGRDAVNWWSADHATADDPMLIEQIRRHILPKRGILARPDEILITLGTQHGLYMLMQILVDADTTIGIEDPGDPDARNIAMLSPGAMRLLPIDEGGLVVGPHLDGVNVAIVTIANQCPTMVSMPRERRLNLLEWAQRNDAIVIEDEYENDASAGDNELPALAGLDGNGRVIHLGTFSKVLAPGVRLGYMVGPRALIEEARALRRLIHRCVPLNNQRTAALFIADGHYSGLVGRLATVMAERRALMRLAIDRVLPDFHATPADSGTSIWLKCPDGVEGPRLADVARRRGVIVERGDPFFANPQAGLQYVRLGFSSIDTSRIELGLRALGEAAVSLGEGDVPAAG